MFNFFLKNALRLFLVSTILFFFYLQTVLTYLRFGSVYSLPFFLDVYVFRSFIATLQRVWTEACFLCYRNEFSWDFFDCCTEDLEASSGFFFKRLFYALYWGCGFFYACNHNLLALRFYSQSFDRTSNLNGFLCYLIFFLYTPLAVSALFSWSYSEAAWFCIFPVLFLAPLFGPSAQVLSILLLASMLPYWDSDDLLNFLNISHDHWSQEPISLTVYTLKWSYYWFIFCATRPKEDFDMVFIGTAVGFIFFLVKFIFKPYG